MRVASNYSAFNARWLEPEDVARSFVATTHYESLLRTQNSLLMGPRGCGKTTLLKMLTRRAQKIWIEEHLSNEKIAQDYRPPDFEVIYIASDIRWKSELDSLPAALPASPKVAELVQRCLVSISALIECTKTFEEILEEKDIDPTELAKKFILHFGLGATLPLFAEIRVRLRDWIEVLQGHLVRGDQDGLEKALAGHHSSLYGHSLSAPTKACSIFDEYVRTAAPRRWALCFDEIEIAPSWLQDELFKALRSFEQRFLLKITWSPVLPEALAFTQERHNDFAAIQMWHGHVNDARPFCNEFATRYVQDKFNSATLTPREVFGYSLFSQEDSEGAEVYGRGSAIWLAMQRLAGHDESFRQYLQDHNISPEDPTAFDVAVRDKSLRKAKPVVILREAYRGKNNGQRQRRSRKNVSVFFGEDVIYAMSEGNPRLLRGLLNDLFDEAGKPSASWPIGPEVQSRVFNAAAERTLAGIRAHPTKGSPRKKSLGGIVESVGEYLHDELVFGEFSVDPAGSFFVDEDVHPSAVQDINVGLLLGAFVHVKTKDNDLPTSIVGSRFRLSYMLSPRFGLPFRANRAIRLSTALKVQSSGQRAINFLGDR